MVWLVLFRCGFINGIINIIIIPQKLGYKNAFETLSNISVMPSDMCVHLYKNMHSVRSVCALSKVYVKK